MVIYEEALTHGIELFFKKHNPSLSPLVLGISGGADSTALLYLILSTKLYREGKLSLHLAHVDHGWREESASEARILEEMALALKIPFHATRLTTLPKSNFEMEGRLARLKFFKEVLFQIGGGALLLAHHADDHTETILKRLLEGAFMTKVSGMKGSALVDGIRILRPLLGVRKEELIAFLINKGISWFEDSTNKEERFLRGRMREQIFPFVEERFGKEISSNLCYLAATLSHVTDHFEKKFRAEIFPLMTQGPLGLFLPLGAFTHLSHIERECLLVALADRAGVELSRAARIELLARIEQDHYPTSLQLKQDTIFLDRHALFFAKKLPPFVPFILPKEEGQYLHHGWIIRLEVVTSTACTHSWKHFLETGLSSFVLPQGSITELGVGNEVLALPLPGARYGQVRLKKWLVCHQVPAFLRYWVPVLMSQGRIVGEFLSGAPPVSDFSADQMVGRDLASELFIKVSIAVE